MHQHKIVAQVILILSIVNFVRAAPAVREIHGARDDMSPWALTEDVGAVAEKRGNAFGTQSTPLEASGPVGGSADDGYETASDEPFDHSSTLATPGGHLSTSATSSEPSDHSSTPTELLPPQRPAPSREKPKIITPEKMKAVKIIAAAGLVTTAVLGLVVINLSLKDISPSN